MRLSFSLRTLLIAVAVVCILTFAASFYLRCRRAVSVAREEYHLEKASVDAEMSTIPKLCAASERLLAAELHCPFGNHQRAVEEHLARLDEIHRKEEALLRIGLFGRPPTAERLKVIEHYQKRARALAD